MAHLNGQALQTWNKGDSLTADALNANFQIIADRLERVMAQALLPDAANTDLQMRMRAIVERVSRLEDLTAMHARQRNEREWAPLSHLGAVLVRVADLQKSVEDAVARLEKAHAEIIATHDRQHVRISRLEQQPEAASVEAHNELAYLHADTMQKAKMALGQAIALRHEITILRALALGHDRQANRLEFAPLSTVGHLLQRIMALENVQP